MPGRGDTFEQWPKQARQNAVSGKQQVEFGRYCEERSCTGASLVLRRGGPSLCIIDIGRLAALVVEA